MIKLESVSKYYTSAGAVVPALRRIKLEFHKGEFVAITGESGSGKSSLLNIISGLDTYDEGELFIQGEATSHFDDDDWEEYRKNKIGYVFQNYNLIENYSSLYNVESALLIQGYEYTQARKRAKELLKKVGLKGQMGQRASRLSSGQKQRLSIARALAKDTDIIVADEPTGNLDSETGSQIMELFGELSKDKLVIVVTHNYEEVEPYATRRLRLHDGEVVSDIQIKEPVPVARKKEEEKNENKKTGQARNKKNTDRAQQEEALKSPRPDRQLRKMDRNIARRFTRMNIATQRGRVLLFLCFLLFTSVVSFIFLGEIYSNMDDTFTKDYDSRAFLNGDNTRIIVKRADGNAITKDDMETFRGIKHVRMVDQYDYANDINYYITMGADYDYSYQPDNNLTDTAPAKIVNFLLNTKFVKSDTCITEADLASGRLPKARNEVVLYSEEESVLGSQQICYFTSKNMWGYDNYYSATFTIVGLLKEKSDQVYFSGELCNMLSADLYDNSYNMRLGKNLITGTYNINLSFIPVIGDDLNYGELKVSSVIADTSVYEIPGAGEVTIYYSGEDDEYSDIKNYDVTVLPRFNSYSIKFVEISEDWFYELCDYQSSQASLYIRDYIDTDYVLEHLEKLGYQAISPYRVSSIEYNSWKVDLRNAALERAFLVLAVLFLLEVLIIGSFLKIKKKDYLLLTSMGMKHRTIKLMNYYELLTYTGAAVLITGVGANAVNLCGFRYLGTIMKYYNVTGYAAFILFNLLMIVTTVWFFNRYLKRKQKWS